MCTDIPDVPIVTDSDVCTFVLDALWQHVRGTVPFLLISRLCECLGRSTVAPSETHPPILTGRGHEDENRDCIANKAFFWSITHYIIQLQHNWG
jgi:hypothetical protein